MSDAPSNDETANSGSGPSNRFVYFALRERMFLGFILVAFMAAALTSGSPQLAMWVGFLFAGYAAVANDSIQTLGTFIGSNKEQKWWLLWLFIGGIFIATMTISWLGHGGGLKVHYFENAAALDADEVLTEELLPGTRYEWVEHPAPPEVGDTFVVVAAGDYRARESGTRTLAIDGCDGAMHLTFAPPTGDPIEFDYLDATEPVFDRAEVEVEQGIRYGFRLEYHTTGTEARCPIGWVGEDDDGEEVVESIATENLFNDWYGGDVSYGRLSSKGFDRTPTELSFLQIAAPIFLMILTRMKMPVSTSFLLLTSFATKTSAVGKMLMKSLMGYGIALGVALLVWGLFGRLMKKYWSGTKPAAFWRPLQWASTGLLWAMWLAQDAANIAVYLPRSLNPVQFAFFVGVIFGGLGLLFFMRGEAIQEVVDEKSDVVDVRMATVIDFVYAIILYYFKIMSKIPMSTTWVFIGLLGGRELVMSLVKASDRSPMFALRMMAKDLAKVTIGLIVSMVIAYAVNQPFREQIHIFVGLESESSEVDAPAGGDDPPSSETATDGSADDSAE